MNRKKTLLVVNDMRQMRNILNFSLRKEGYEIKVASNEESNASGQFQMTYTYEMSDDMQVAKVLDLKGLACPMPVVKVSKGIKEVAVGEVIEAQTTDPGSLTDFPAWAKTSGNEIVKTEQEDKLITFYIKRLA